MQREPHRVCIRSYYQLPLLEPLPAAASWKTASHSQQTLVILVLTLPTVIYQCGFLRVKSTSWQAVGSARCSKILAATSVGPVESEVVMKGPFRVCDAPRCVRKGTTRHIHACGKNKQRITHTRRSQEREEDPHDMHRP